MNKVMEIELEKVFLYKLDKQVPVVLLWDGRLYGLLEEPAGKQPEAELLPHLMVKQETEEQLVPDATKELQKIIVDRHNEHGGKYQRKRNYDGADRGGVVARCDDLLIYRKPLDEMIELKRQDRATPLNRASVIHKYYSDIGLSTVAQYGHSYMRFINKDVVADIRSNIAPLEHETVTDKDKEKIVSVIADANSHERYPDSDGILRELDMTEYKLKLALEKLDAEKKIESVVNGKKIVYHVVEIKDELPV